MELPFDLNIDSAKNYLPKDGTVNYYGVIFTLRVFSKIFPKFNGRYSVEK
jgi:hypothetical protein